METFQLISSNCDATLISVMVAELEVAAIMLFRDSDADPRIREIEHVAVNRPHCVCGGATPLHLGGCPKMAALYAEMDTARG